MAYVYALVNPETMKPFYVGKGSRYDRPNAHILESKTESTTLKCNIIRKILKSNNEIIILRSDEISEEDAFEIEMLLIDDYGRRNNNTGILSNMTDGGEGSSGWKHTKESIKKLSKAMKGREISNENKERLRKELTDRPLLSREGVKDKVIGTNHWSARVDTHPLKGVKLSEETKRKISKTLTGRKTKPCSDEQKELLRQVHLGRKVEDTSKFHWERKKIECPHCKKEGSVANMKRWHFDNCKELNND